MNWDKFSWRKYVNYYQITWPDINLLNNVLSQLSKLPALVFAEEIRTLKLGIKGIDTSNTFILQCGDCAEKFSDCHGPKIHNFIRIILQMSLIISYLTNKKIIRIGRIAGQYAKPRSNDFEFIGGEKIYSYKGDMINSIEPTKEGRIPKAERILEGYFRSAATLNLIRAFTKGGYASLNHVLDWQKHYFVNYPIMQKYKDIANEIIKAINFTKSLGLDINNPSFSEVNFYISHEAFLLEYEEALTRIDTLTNTWYDTSAHMLWLGHRTRIPNSAHVEFLRGVNNPIGIKIGPNCNLEELNDIISVLNPSKEEGKIILIPRLGVANIEKELPLVIESVLKHKQNVVWICDPMHGNTYTGKDFKKIRKFDDIAKEFKLFCDILREYNIIPGGVHLELTADNVTECIGGFSTVTESMLNTNYDTYCDPRLNAEQAIELAFYIADSLNQNN